MRIWITEVAPRDGLQNVKERIPTDRKVAFVDMLSETGVDEIEVTAFVHPKWVPQMADAQDVLRRIKRNPKVIYSAIVPNEKGLERALETDLDKIAVLTAATDTFNLKNINTDIEGSFQRLIPVVRKAKTEGLKVRGYVSVAFWCPYEGKVPPQRVKDMVLRLFDVGVDEVSLGDTIGRASPSDVKDLLEIILKDIPPDKIVLHFHATYGMAIANVICAWKEFGIYRFDTSAGGLGGCPYAPGASGNAATEDVAFALRESGADVRVDIKRVIESAESLGLPLESAISRVPRENL
ncbi:MAG: hydroxymethylglutaryl-CoA lyase [Thermotogae bacterium]|nr:hydroxymethylglutaryl-CoA lyase [Thermotogota bacterium]